MTQPLRVTVRGLDKVGDEIMTRRGDSGPGGGLDEESDTVDGRSTPTVGKGIINRPDP